MSEPPRLPLSILTDIVSPEDEAGAIPMLTDVVTPPKPQPVRYGDAPLPETVDKLDWGALEQRVREQVITQLSGSASELFDKRMNSLMATVLNRHFDALREELQLMLAHSLRDIVIEAVRIELTALQGEIERSRRQ